MMSHKTQLTASLYVLLLYDNVDIDVYDVYMYIYIYIHTQCHNLSE